jgi:hypothetical protein
MKDFDGFQDDESAWSSGSTAPPDRTGRMLRGSGCRTVLNVFAHAIERVPHRSERVRARDRAGAAPFCVCPRA